MSEPITKSDVPVQENSNEQGDDSVYKRGQQNKWTRARTGDKKGGDNKRFKKSPKEREHKVT